MGPRYQRLQQRSSQENPGPNADWPRYTIPDIFELMFWVGVLLAIMRAYHWLPAALIAVVSAVVFAIWGRKRRIMWRPEAKWVIVGVASLWFAYPAEWSSMLLGTSRFWESFVRYTQQSDAAQMLTLTPLAGLILVSFLPIAFTALLMGRRSYTTLVVFALLSPMSFGCMHAMYDFYWGTPVLPGKFLGHWTPNPDPLTRLLRQQKNRPSATDWFQDVSYENTLDVLTRIFGPARGAYTGPYPTEEQARQALLDAKAFTDEELDRDVVVLRGQKVFLKGLRACASRPVSGRSQLALLITDWQYECIVVGDNSPGTDVISSIFLYSRTTGERFAHYGN